MKIDRFVFNLYRSYLALKQIFLMKNFIIRTLIKLGIIKISKEDFLRFMKQRILRVSNEICDEILIQSSSRPSIRMKHKEESLCEIRIFLLTISNGCLEKYLSHDLYTATINSLINEVIWESININDYEQSFIDDIYHSRISFYDEAADVLSNIKSTNSIQYIDKVRTLWSQQPFSDINKSKIHNFNFFETTQNTLWFVNLSNNYITSLIESMRGMKVDKI